MVVDKEISRKISEDAANTCDPIRAERNLQRFVERNPDFKKLAIHLSTVSRLFAVSQFLANYCIANPDELYSAVKERKKGISRRLLVERVKRELGAGEDRTGQRQAAMSPDSFSKEKVDAGSMMKALRLFKKRYLLRITIRDITGETDIMSSMDELSVLAEVIISMALKWSIKFNGERYGLPVENNIALIALGKLGGEELNYSSDVDLIAVYASDDGETPGIMNPAGIMFNRISVHEFYCKVVEFLGKLLSTQTEEGIAYRVDLRLRPQGQKGVIALPLNAYLTYYESWGRTWERMALIRARPVAGDVKLGKRFMKKIEPFVWRRTIDYAELEEIKGLKRKIDSTFTNNDIKRGYGGIREAEFFIQTFQLLYAGENSSLKSYRILNAIQALKWMNMVPAEDLTALWHNYLYLRRVEHYLQMSEDLQTHTLPHTTEEKESLALKMGFKSDNDFMIDLRLKRMRIKNMYNSLLGSQEDLHAETLNLLEGKLNDRELSGYLSFRRVKHPDKCLTDMKSIREHIAAFKTVHERKVTREVMPQLLENALMAESPDRAIAGLEKLLTTYGVKPAHMSALKTQTELMTGIIKLFSLSPYLTRIFLSDQHYLDILIEEWSILKTLKEIEKRLGRALDGVENFEAVLAEFRRFEEIRIGILFLLNILTVEDLFRGLSHLAEAIIRAAVDRAGSARLSVIALGKLGGREMTFGSDIDIIFVSEAPDAMILAEKVLKVLTAYTDMGQLYSVDTRLRPDGSKGILVNDLDGYRNYYLAKAQDWEIQALLKARPVGGDENLARSFINMAKDVILQRGNLIKKGNIREMRERIVRELSNESKGVDIKLGPGGIEEIEFFIQFLQLHHARACPEILVQNVLLAINRMAKKDILSAADRDVMYNSYEYYRKLQTFLRLNEEEVIMSGSGLDELAAKFMGYTDVKELFEHLKKLRKNVLQITGLS